MTPRALQRRLRVPARRVRRGDGRRRAELPRPCSLSSAAGLGRALSRAGAGRLLSLGQALVNLSSCVLLDRFRGLQSAAALEAAAQRLRQRNGLLASK